MESIGYLIGHLRTWAEAAITDQNAAGALLPGRTPVHLTPSPFSVIPVIFVADSSWRCDRQVLMR
jgi:hypothetical protein